MRLKSIVCSNFIPLNAAVLASAALLSGCGGSDSSSDNVGYVKFYNGSTNAPEVILTIDEDLDDDLELLEELEELDDL